MVLCTSMHRLLLITRQVLTAVNMAFRRRVVLRAGTEVSEKIASHLLI